MKETFYFQHDYNATQDPKIMALIAKCGLAGVGMYWILIELLHQQPDSKIKKETYEDYINFYGRVDYENEQVLNKLKQVLNKLKQVLIDVGLFVEQDNFIFSERVLENKKQREILSKKRSLAGKKSAEVRQNLTSVKQTVNKGQQGKERKGKERKENINILVSGELDNSGVVSSEQNLTTPKNISDNFFNNEQDRNEKIDLLIKKNNWPEQSVKQEIAKFISYWTELNSTGKKQRWEMEKTFEIDRRLATWFSRAAKFAPGQSRFINLDNL